jgi:Predicted hydrolases or acyltransferases (alpha/beta hydrolase superfamily)
MSKQIYALDLKETLLLGGERQHIRIRGTDTANPVLLFLHGGPGVSDRHWVLKYQSSLAEVCTMVCWDQRGSGKSYSKELAAKTMNIGMMVDDAAELAEYLCDRFHKEKIYVVGHSWGSCLGVLLVQKCPERIAAYVGMGQLVDLDENERLSYEFVLDEAKKRNDKKGLRDLAKIGEPVDGLYKNFDDFMTQRKYMSKYGGGTYNKRESLITSVVIPILKSSEYKLADLVGYAKGSFYSLHQLWDEMAQTICFSKSAVELKVPVYITQGSHDQNTPTPIAKKWFDNLKAPHKEWIEFAYSAHSPIKEEPELWGKVIREKLFAK